MSRKESILDAIQRLPDDVDFGAAISAHGSQAAFQYPGAIYHVMNRGDHSRSSSVTPKTVHWQTASDTTSDEIYAVMRPRYAEAREGGGEGKGR
jgi:hypothetical protein